MFYPREEAVPWYEDQCAGAQAPADVKRAQPRMIAVTLRTDPPRSRIALPAHLPHTL
jgi:hypothetical protein